MESRQETEEVTGSKAPLQGAAWSLWGNLERGCPRWSAPWGGGNSTPVHFLGQHAPPIPLGQDRKVSRTRQPRGETQRCSAAAVLR